MDSTASTIPTKKPRLLIVTELYPRTPGDHTGAFVQDQARKLIDWYEVTIITVHEAPSLRHRRPSVQPQRNDQGITVYSLPYYPWWLLGLAWYRIISKHRMIYLNKYFTGRSIRKLALQLHRQKAFELVHGHETYFGDEAGPIGKLLGIPSVFTLHGFYEEHLRTFGQAFMKQVIKNLHLVNRLLTDSMKAANTYQQFLTAPFTPIPNGLDAIPAGSLPEATIAFLNRRPFLLSVGALSPSKRFEVSVRALAEVHQRGHSEYALVMVGRGTEEQSIRSLIKELHLENDVQIISGITRPEIRGLFEQSEIVLHPSIVEAFCIVVLEGLAAGKAVVATTNIGIMDYLRPGQDVIAVPPNDQPHFSKAVSRLVEHPEERQRLGDAARETANRFTWQSVANALHEIYSHMTTSD